MAHLLVFTQKTPKILMVIQNSIERARLLRRSAAADADYTMPTALEWRSSFIYSCCCKQWQLVLMIAILFAVVVVVFFFVDAGWQAGWLAMMMMITLY